MSEKRTPIVMPWGRHKGKPMSEVPTDYLRYHLDQGGLGPRMWRLVEEELESRGAWFHRARKCPFCKRERQQGVVEYSEMRGRPLFGGDL